MRQPLQLLPQASFDPQRSDLLQRIDPEPGEEAAVGDLAVPGPHQLQVRLPLLRGGTDHLQPRSIRGQTAPGRLVTADAFVVFLGIQRQRGLAAGLERYSERGQDYIDEIRSIIRFNDLDELDTGTEVARVKDED